MLQGQEVAECVGLEFRLAYGIAGVDSAKDLEALLRSVIAYWWSTAASTQQ